LEENIYTYDDLLKMLDAILKEQSRFNWDNFFSNRERNVPIFSNVPDENLVSYFDRQLLKSGRVLELGCGPGRNAIYFAEKGCRVDAVDLSEVSLDWAKERAKEKDVRVNFIHQNLFDLEVEEGVYDIVYDSGCFHHIAPHRRMNYIELVKKALKPNGYFAITCFVPGGEFGGAEISDWEVYRIKSLKGGLGYTEEKIRTIFKDFKEIEIRKMDANKPSNSVFAVSGLLTGLFQKS
jgi:SAM-dependent methyltransferase